MPELVRVSSDTLTGRDRSRRCPLLWKADLSPTSRFRPGMTNWTWIACALSTLGSIVEWLRSPTSSYNDVILEFPRFPSVRMSASKRRDHELLFHRLRRSMRGRGSKEKDGICTLSPPLARIRLPPHVEQGRPDLGRHLVGKVRTSIGVATTRKLMVVSAEY